MKKYYLIFTLILSSALFLRFIWLDKAPASLYYDEIDLGYQMRSLLETGRDYRGSISPFYFRSFNTDKTPLPIILSIPFSLLFNTSEYQVRAGTAAAGVLVVLVGMLIVYELTKSNLASAITGIVFATSPWLIHFSRIAFEAQFALLFYLSFAFFIFRWRRTNSKTDLYLSAVTLGLSVYTYRTMSFLAPVVAVLTSAIFFKHFKKISSYQVVICFAIVSVLITPFLYSTTIGSKDQTRINQISIFSDPMVPIMVQRHREVDSGDYQKQSVGSQATLKSKIFFNKLVSYTEKYRDNLFRNFSADFLFLSGDPNGRHSTKNTGALLFVDIIGLLVGIFVLHKNARNLKYLFVFVLLLLGTIPADLTIDGANHASRLITMAGPLLIIVSLGYYQTFKYLSEARFGKFFGLLLILVWSFSALEFFNKYFFHFPIENHREFGYGYKEVVEKAKRFEDQYQHLYITDRNDPPMLYYLFWSNTPPSLLQSYGTEFGDDIKKDLSLDKVKPKHFDIALCDAQSILKLSNDSLYVVAFNDLPIDFRPGKNEPPQGIKLLDTVLYPNNEPAYYLITRDVKDGKDVSPLKNQKCR